MHRESRDIEPRQSTWREVLRKRVVRAVGTLAISSMAISCLGGKTNTPEGLPFHNDITTESTVSYEQPTPSERLVIPQLADPHIFKDRDNSFYLAGTNEIDTDIIPIYHTPDLKSHELITAYSASVKDSKHDYCNLWAPAMMRTKEGQYRMYFTARQVHENQPCEDSRNDQAIFYAEADDNNMVFGAPHKIHLGPHDPRTYTPRGCPTDGCESALRIDPEIVRAKDGDDWLFYTWYGHGQNIIASVNLDDPYEHHSIAVPVAGDGNINEAPDVFERNGQYYMIYSHNFYNQAYGLKYISANRVWELTRKYQRAHTIASAQRDQQGRLISNIGHSSVVEYNDRYYIYYHKGAFDHREQMRDRSTYTQELLFDGDAIRPLTVP